MTNETYNGWTNRETWLANLWLTNDQGIYEHVIECLKENEPGLAPAMETLRGIVEGLCFESYAPNAGLPTDFMWQCIDRINYAELLRAFEDSI